MPILTVKELQARMAAAKIGTRSSNFIRLETDRPITVHILPALKEKGGEDSLWFRQIGSHWLGKKRVACGNPTQDEDGSCFICEMIKQQREELAEAKREHENDSGEEALANAQVFKAVEESLQKISPRRAFVFNVVIREKDGSQEVPKTIEAPWNLFQPIYNMFNSALNDYETDITDPEKSIPFELKKTGQGKTGTRYSATAAPLAKPIYSGPGAAEKLEKVLQKMLNLDEHYRLPTEEELIKAWNEYAPDESDGERTPAAAASPAPKPAPPKPASPPSMSRIGKPANLPLPKKLQQLQTESEEGEDEIPGLENNAEPSEREPAEEEAIPSKSEAQAASLKLLTRLKKGAK